MRWRELKETAAKGQKVSRPRTSKRRDEILRLHLIPEFGDHTLSSITTGRINDLVNRWQKIVVSRVVFCCPITVEMPQLEDYFANVARQKLNCVDNHEYRNNNRSRCFKLKHS